MMLAREIVEEFCEAVGARYFSDDPSTCMSYAWNAGLGGVPKPTRLSPTPPVGVALPGSTEEVQAVIKVCLKHGIRFKPHSTGYGSLATPASPDSIAIDLRRMNRMEIDERNQMAILEPYVTAGQLQTEAMKRGLNCHIVGAGLTHSPLASATACFGIGISGTTTGNNVRNLLGLEWVTPTGDIVRIGSPGAGAGWFTDEGPGPGFRGMIRGVVGTMGELGVFTRIGYKLHPWPGPKALTRTGRHPQVGIEIPENCRLYHIAWQDWAHVTKATYEINKSDVAYVLVRIPPNSYGLALSATNNDFYAMATRGTPEIASDTDACRHTWTLFAASSSAREAEYKDRVIRNILEKTGGRVVPLAKEHEALAANLLLTSIYIPRVLRPSSAMSTSFGVMESFSRLSDVMRAGEKCLGEDIRPGGQLMQGAREEFWSWPSERRHLWAESAFSYNVNVPESRGAVFRVMLEHGNMVEKRGDLGFDAFASLGPLADFYSPAVNGASAWMRKIKLLFDKKNLNDAQFYISRTPPSIARSWPAIRRLLFWRPFRPMFKRQMNKLAAGGIQALVGKGKGG